mgnify:CR=1
MVGHACFSWKPLSAKHSGKMRASINLGEK